MNNPISIAVTDYRGYTIVYHGDEYGAIIDDMKRDCYDRGLFSPETLERATQAAMAREIRRAERIAIEVMNGTEGRTA